MHLKWIVDTSRTLPFFGKKGKWSFLVVKAIFLGFVLFLLGYVVVNALSKCDDVLTTLDDHLLGVKNM